jgi:hypothetical protein
MRCKNITITETIVCAKTCFQKMNESPVAKFSFENYVLSDDSTYFDDGNIVSREIRWKVYVDNYFFYDFGWHAQDEVVVPLANGSTYGELNLGLLNQDIFTLLSAEPSTIIPVGTKLSIQLDVKDSMGVESQNISNTYCFTK